MQTSSSKATHTKMNASCNRLKYNETAENTKNAKMTSSQMTKTTTSTLDEEKLEVDEKKETDAQSCFDRIWYSLSCSARFDLVIIASYAAFLPPKSFSSQSTDRQRIVGEKHEIRG